MSGAGSDSQPEARPIFEFLTAALADRDADGFVHVARGDDPTLRYLSQRPGDEWDPLARTCAFVFVDGQAWLCRPEGTRSAVADEISVRTFPHRQHAGECAAELLAADAESVLVPPHLPHDAALYLEQAGVDLASTRAVATARARKTPAEVDRLRAAQRAAVAGIERAGELLAASDAPSATRLRREIDTTLAKQGVSDAGNTRIEGEIRSGGPVHVALAPRGPGGYHAALGRTFAVDNEGGWERRAHVAVTSARRVALAELEPGAETGWIREETIAELGSFGFTVGASDGAVCPDVGGGIGLARAEAPSFRRDAELEPGHVVRIAPGVRHETHGTVRTVDVARVTQDGAEWLVDAPTSLAPTAYE
ncbi:MAG: M24 family metallopeptidase [Halorientalis sp.]